MCVRRGSHRPTDRKAIHNAGTHIAEPHCNRSRGERSVVHTVAVARTAGRTVAAVHTADAECTDRRETRSGIRNDCGGDDGCSNDRHHHHRTARGDGCSNDHHRRHHRNRSCCSNGGSVLPRHCRRSRASRQTGRQAPGQQTFSSRFLQWYLSKSEDAHPETCDFPWSVWGFSYSAQVARNTISLKNAKSLPVIVDTLTTGV